MTGPRANWELVVLGVAQDGGLPHFGCECSRCSAARAGERPRERVACLGLTDGKRGFVFDATPDFADQVHALGVPCPDGVFLTHAHMGHYTGLVGLGPEVQNAHGVAVYATSRMQRFLSTNAPWRSLVDGGHVTLRSNESVDLGSVRVTSFAVPHRDELSDTVGYRIDGPQRSALFIPDIDAWGLWDTDIREAVDGVDVAFLDATFFSLDELPHRDLSQIRHPLVTDTMDRLEGLGHKVRLIHLNHSNPLFGDAGPASARGFELARQGERITL